MLVHAAAHIQVDPSDTSNDLDPRFTQHFHRSLKVLTQGARGIPSPFRLYALQACWADSSCGNLFLSFDHTSSRVCLKHNWRLHLPGIRLSLEHEHSKREVRESCYYLFMQTLVQGTTVVSHPRAYLKMSFRPNSRAVRRAFQAKRSLSTRCRWQLGVTSVSSRRLRDGPGES